LCILLLFLSLALHAEDYAGRLTPLIDLATLATPGRRGADPQIHRLSIPTFSTGNRAREDGRLSVLRSLLFTFPPVIPESSTKESRAKRQRKANHEINHCAQVA